eukprot:5212248-Prymnesium_polylepis.1
MCSIRENMGLRGRRFRSGDCASEGLGLAAKLPSEPDVYEHRHVDQHLERLTDSAQARVL